VIAPYEAGEECEGEEKVDVEKDGKAVLISDVKSGGPPRLKLFRK